jgi:hypothetical protein
MTRAALFCKDLNGDAAAQKLNAMYYFCKEHNYVITETFRTEMAVLNAREDFDILLSCNESILLPLSDIQVINVAAA